MAKTNTKKLVVSALLVGLSVVIPYISLPVVPIPEFSVTLFAHVAILVAMFMGIKTALLTGLGSVLGFYLKGVPLVVVMRAASHLIFLILGALMIKKFYGKKWKVALICVITGLVHALFEALIVAFWFKTASVANTFTIGFPVFFAHHTFDFIMSFIIYTALSKAKLTKKLW